MDPNTHPPGGATIDTSIPPPAPIAPPGVMIPTTNGAPTAEPPTPTTGGVVGPCSLGNACTAKTQELSDQYRCRYCNKQLHGFISGCSQAKNPKDFRDGVICKEQPCYSGEINKASSPSKGGTGDGVAHAAAAGLPEFLWETQQPKRKRDPNAPKLKRQRYTKQHKEMVLSTLQSNPSTKLPEVAKQFNIPEGTLRGWYDEDRRAKAATNQGGLDDPAATAAIGDLTDPLLDGTPPAPLVEGAAAVDPDDTNPKKKRRQRYSNETKIQVILALETRPNVSLNEVAKEFKVAAGTVRGWREEADKIQKQAMENRRVGAKANPSRDPLRRIWAAILSLFEKNSRLPVDQRLDVNVAVVRTIGRQARDRLLEAHGERNNTLLTPTEVVNMEKFKASETWARKWARDHAVISSKQENSATQLESALGRVTDLQKIMQDYPPERVYSMTSTGIFYRILPHRTYVSRTTTDQKRIRACKGLKSKDRLTLYLCTNESGSDKLPITCIGKYENPACFRVSAQKVLPYLSQKQALNDAGTFQRWWRSVFLPHVRSHYQDGEKCLLLVESMGPCKADLLKDPTNQVRVEALPPGSPTAVAGSTKNETGASGNANNASSSKDALPQCQALEYGILETIKRRYRYRLLQEVMDTFDERWHRRQVAKEADFPLTGQGLREGNLANIADAMRLLDSIWQEVATTTISKSWQRTKLRPKSKDDLPTQPAGTRAKSEKRQTTREKKQLVKDLNNFLTKHEAKDFTKDEGANQLEEMVEKLKNCFLYTDGEVIETKEMVESLEEWICLEDSTGMTALFMEELKQEMNIEYLTGLKDAIEGVVPEAEEPEEIQLETELVEKNREKENEELDLPTALELAATIKATASKLFAHGNILGELAVRLDGASDSVFRLLRKQKEAAIAKVEAEKAKAVASAKKQKAAASAPSVDDMPATEDSTSIPVTDAASAHADLMVETPAGDEAAVDAAVADLPSDIPPLPEGLGDESMEISNVEV